MSKMSKLKVLVFRVIVALAALTSMGVGDCCPDQNGDDGGGNGKPTCDPTPGCPFRDTRPQPCCPGPQ